VNRAQHTFGALLAVLALAAAVPDAAAQELPMRDPAADVINFDNDKPLKEDKIKLPPAPKAENLIPFDAGPARRGFEHFVDRASLTVDDDGVIRYILVVKSDMGARNVTYEGIRCVTREHKVYAYARRDGSWAEPHHSEEWRKIATADLEGPIYLLYADFFCPGRAAVRSADEAIAALKIGEHPRASDDDPSRLIPLGK
jgi:CNP1-like family